MAQYCQMQHNLTWLQYDMQALNQKAGTGAPSGKLLSPLPKEEDRRLPLKKWMESMKDLAGDLSKGAGPPR